MECVERSVLSWLATASADGQPNVSPKEIFAAAGASRVVIANIASPGSVRNIEENPHVCLSFVDVFRQKGYKLIGTAVNVRKANPRFAALSEPLIKLTKGVFPIHSVIDLTVTEVQSILAPSYRLIPGTTEESQVAAAMLAYGVQPLSNAVGGQERPVDAQRVI